MIKRPSSGDTEQDILKMQSDFLLEQYKNNSFEPAAKVVKMETSKAREPSDFAKKRAAMRLKQSTPDASGATAPEDPLIPPAGVSPASTVPAYTPIIGNIVERNTSGSSGHERQCDSIVDRGFPQPMRLQRSNMAEGTSSKSLFAQSRSKTVEKSTEIMDTNSDATTTTRTDFGEQSYILSTQEAVEIHAENVKHLSQMDEKQLMEQRQQLLDTMDPDLVKFLRSKRSRAPPTVEPIVETPPMADVVDITDPDPVVDNEATLSLLNDPNYAQWPNFDVVEPAKLEWMRDIQANLPTLKEGEAYEARFDWKGVLLPYTMPTDTSDSPADDRDLYLHGADAQRPGYTLQELFRLARSNVTQQRVSALGAIAGLLNIYNQGFYDAVLDVPVSKCFFLLRFAFDENVPGILEVSAKALATLLHNDADEILLDFTRDCSVDFREPIHAVRAVPAATGAAGDVDDVERKFAQIHLSKQNRTRPAMQTSVNNDDDEADEANRESLNDFHLAEIDLVECLLRTNIVRRIDYVLFSVRPDNSTVLSCLKILIRLARSGETVLESLFADNLLRNVCAAFLPPLGQQTAAGRFYDRPQYMALKLVRCVASYGREWCDRVLQWGVFDVLKSYVFVRDDIKIELIKLQIEAFRLAKVIILSHMQNQLYNELTPAMHYMLEWCYQFLQFERTGHLIIRQHAAALLTLISSVGPNGNGAAIAPIVDKVRLCCSKWFRLATVHGIEEFSQHMLLATCLNACVRLSGDGFHEFYAQYLVGFLRSEHYTTGICGNLPRLSPLLRRISLRPNPHEALPHLHSVVVNDATGAPDYVFGQQYAVHMCTALVNLLAALHAGQHRRLFADVMAAMWCPQLQSYIDQLAARPWNAALRGNWFVRNELALLGGILKCAALREQRIPAAVAQQLAYKVSVHLAEDQVEEVLHLFDAVLFDAAHFASPHIDAEVLSLWKDIYTHLCFEHVQLPDDCGLMVSNHRQPALQPNWPCAPMIQLLREVMQPTKVAAVLPEQDLIRSGLLYIDALHAHGVSVVTPTEHLMVLMVAHLGAEGSFLEPAMNAVLGECVHNYFVAHRDTHLDLEQASLAGGTTFENLYLLLIDHFQGTSYGDASFGALVMVPLAQRYAVRWRQLVWSEHLAVMRFVQTPAERLLGGDLRPYLEPAERDVTQLKYYHQAEQSMSFAEGSVALSIVRHHLGAHRERLAQQQKQRRLVETKTAEA